MVTFPRFGPSRSGSSRAASRKAENGGPTHVEGRLSEGHTESRRAATFERLGGASGVIGVASIATQYMLVGTTIPDRSVLLHDRMRWEYATLLRLVGGLSTNPLD